MKRRPEATGWVWLRGVVWGVLPWVAAVRMQGQVLVEEVRTFTVGTTLGDVQDPPATFGVTVGDSAVQVLTGVKVGLRLVGAPQGFASEMVVMLTKDLAATSVLLNRVGVGVGRGHGWVDWVWI